MSQSGGSASTADTRVGFLVKRAQAALNAVMDQRLRSLGLGVSQYACLAQIGRRPGISNADLARLVFVSRQATHQLLAGIVAAGLVEVEGVGRAQRFTLTRAGSERLAAASRVVDEVESAMVRDLSDLDRASLIDQLNRCAASLEAESAKSRV